MRAHCINLLPGIYIGAYPWQIFLQFTQSAIQKWSMPQYFWPIPAIQVFTYLFFSNKQSMQSYDLCSGFQSKKSEYALGKKYSAYAYCTYDVCILWLKPQRKLGGPHEWNTLRSHFLFQITFWHQGGKNGVCWRLGSRVERRTICFMLQKQKSYTIT